MGGQKAILVFNEEERERRFLVGLLKAEDCPVFDTSNALEALRILQKEDIGVVLAGGHIEGMDGPEFKSLVEKIRPGASTVIFSSFSEGRGDFSVEIEDLVKLVKDFLRADMMLRREQGGLKQFAYSLTDRLIQIFEANNKYFYNNDHRVAELSRDIALRMGLDEALVEAVQMAGLLRDIGKVGIQNQILEGSTRLNESELTPIRDHPVHTMQILRSVSFPWDLDSIISQHHEHYDGSGYPRGLKGRQISIGARIISVSDAFYAMTTDRPYRKALTRESAIKEIKRNAGTQFDPEVVEVFLSMEKDAASVAGRKKSILVFEREPNVAALIKLSMEADSSEILHVTSSIEAVSAVRQRDPELVIADVDSLGPNSFMRFYGAVSQPLKADSRRFLIIVPNDDYPKDLRGNVVYITKPLTVEKFSEKVASLLSEGRTEAPSEEARGLTGTLEDFSLTDIVQILSLGLKTAKVEIVRGREMGVLFLLHGKVVNVSLGAKRGPEAFYELIRWDNGRFQIMHGQTTSEINVTVDTMHLLLEASTIIDERTAAYFR